MKINYSMIYFEMDYDSSQNVQNDISLAEVFSAIADTTSWVFLFH